MKIVVASDSFKGSLSSGAVARAAARGIQSIDSEIDCVTVDVADGGEGLVRSLAPRMNAAMRCVSVHGPLGHITDADYAIADDTAIIEMSAASGLTLVPEEERNPMLTSTEGTGELILDALDHGCRRFLVGIGGSATNDCGLGMLDALGWRFLDGDGHVISRLGGQSLELVEAIDDSSADPRLRECEFTVACDVTNPFCGPDGAAYVFAPQKGADLQMVERLDRGMRHFASAVSAKCGIDVVNVEGAGAAGGLGGAFLAFLGARLQRGIEMVLDSIGFDSIIQDADLVITGEGKVDSQTMAGKTACGVLARCKKYGIPCVAICGKVSMCPELQQAGFAGIFPIADASCSIEEAMNEAVAAANVERTVAQIVAARCCQGTCRCWD